MGEGSSCSLKLTAKSKRSHRRCTRTGQPTSATSPRSCGDLRHPHMATTTTCKANQGWGRVPVLQGARPERNHQRDTGVKQSAGVRTSPILRPKTLYVIRAWLRAHPRETKRQDKACSGKGSPGPETGGDMVAYVGWPR